MMRLTNIMAPVLVALALAMVAGSTQATPPGPRSVRDRVEASMLVTGEIDIDPDGSVSGYRFDEADALPAAVAELLGTNLPRWRFKPVEVDGRPARVSANMSVRLRARKLDGENYIVEITGAHFGSRKDVDTPTSKRLSPPGYPPELARAGVGGVVFLLVKVARDGSVEDVVAEQTNLKTIANERQMQRMRERMEQVAINVAQRRWAFNPPVKPDDAPYWTVRVPVEFVAPGRSQARYGEWEAFVPGPRRSNPWSQEDDGVSPDTLAAGGVYPVGRRGPELLTPLNAPRG